MADTVTVPYDIDLTDSDQDIDALIRGVAWDISSSNIITYSFPTQANQVVGSLSNGAVWSSGFSVDAQNTLIAAMDMVESYTLIDFQQAGTVDGGTIRAFNVTGIGTAYGYYPNTGSSGGDMAFLDGAYTSALGIGRYETLTYAHELGHALGLKHGHETGFGGAMPTDLDSMEYSVMTYRSYDGHNLDELPFYHNADGSYAQTYMISDIAALQRMYGANYDTNSGDTVYTFSTTTGEMFIDGVGQGTPHANKVFRAVWDGNGEDTYDFSNYTTNLRIDLTPGGYSDLDVGGNFQRAELNYGIAYGGVDELNLPIYFYGSQYKVYADGHLYNAYLYEGNNQSLIENAIGGSGLDVLVGNDVGNILEGRGARDVLLGKGGNDTLMGANGFDRIYGGSGADDLYGGNGRDRLNGGKGNDNLYAGGGYDFLTGGANDDTFIIKMDGKMDTILDFGRGDDTLDFSAFNFANEQAALDAGTQVGDDVEFVLAGGTTVLLKNVDLGTIGVDDFLV